jgi:hypothetical protein
MRRHGEEGTSCHGNDCFQTVFIINGALALLATVTSLLLWQRTKHLYAKVIEWTKAERAKRGLQVGDAGLRYSLQAGLIDTHG